MIRNITLHGSLATIAGTDTYRFDVDNNTQLFSAFRSINPKLSLAMLKCPELAIATQDGDKIEDGAFGYGTAPDIHIASAVDGSNIYVQIALLVISLYLSSRMVNKMTGNNATGQKSTMFSGAINSTQQGGAIPIIYGKKCLVGSNVVSSDVQFYNTVT